MEHPTRCPACGWDFNEPSASENPNPKLLYIQQIVATEFHLPLWQMWDMGRKQRPAWARQIAMWLCREATHASFPVIAQHFRRNHSTIINGCEVVAGRMSVAPEFAASMHRLLERVRGADDAVRQAS